MKKNKEEIKLVEVWLKFAREKIKNATDSQIEI